MATISTCDRCLRRLGDMTKWVKVKPTTVITSVPAEHATAARDPEIDLCGDCYESVVSEIKHFAESTRGTP
jgi:hypothetical protein